MPFHTQMFAGLPGSLFRMLEYNRPRVLLFSGEYVDRQLCRDAILPMPVLCEVPCPKDCVLSPWTSWSQCSNTCSGKNSEGKQTRSRSILAYNAGDGRVFTIIKPLFLSTEMVWVELVFGQRIFKHLSELDFHLAEQ